MAASKVTTPSVLEGGSVDKDNGKDKDESSSGRQARSASPDIAKCAICLGDVVNRSCSNSCAHQFCFGCLLEWSKVKPECPLCKTSFRTICHNFRGDDHDEYVVPTPVPHLSIRFTASSTRFSHPFIQVLEARTGHQFSHVARSFDTLSIPASTYHPQPAPPVVMSSNPFSNNFRPETFGDFISEHRRIQEEAIQVPGYQNRRRRYDRNEWVQAFGSTLQPGSVIFPSVEYVRSHPNVTSRLRSWLYRELNVLLGLHRSRDQMAFVYDLIMHLINHYDVRSQDFRDMVTTYFSTKTSHFQHELYHFIISGMSMDEYDRVAEYPANGNRNGSRRNALPEVITIDSDDEGRHIPSFSERQPQPSFSSDVIVLDSSTDEDELPLMITPMVRFQRSEDDPSDAGSGSASSTIRMPALTLGGSARTTAHAPSEENALREDNERDPDMPVLEPQVFDDFPGFDDNTVTVRSSANAPSTATPMSGSRTPAGITNETVNQNLLRPSVLSRSSDRSIRVLEPDFDINLNVSVESYSSPPRHTSRPLTSSDFPILQLRQNMDRDREWDMERTMPNINIAAATVRSFLGLGASSNRPSTSGRGESSSAFVPYAPESNSVREELVRPPRPSCIHDAGSGSPSGFPQSSSSRDCQTDSTSMPAFRIDLYPRGISSSQVMDLSRSAGLVSNSVPSRGTSSRAPDGPSLITLTRTSPVPGTSTRHLAGPSFTTRAFHSFCRKTEDAPAPDTPEAVDSDELECLGSFPIEKKPPLAVITLSSSEDEDESQVKAENQDRLDVLGSDDDTTFLDNFLRLPISPSYPCVADLNLSQLPEFQSSSSSSNCMPFYPISSSSSSAARNRKNSTSTVIQFPSIPSVKFGGSSTSATAGASGSATNNPTSSSSVNNSDRSRKKKKCASPAKSKKRTRRLSSSDNSSENETVPSKAPSPIIMKIPKKRKYPLPPLNEFNTSSSDESDSSSGEDDAGDSDYEDKSVTKRKSKTSSEKKRSSSKKKHKSKSKKTKKSKKSKEKDKSKKSHKRTKRKSPTSAESSVTTDTPSTSSSGSSTSRPRSKLRKTDDQTSFLRSRSKTTVQESSTDSSPIINFSSTSLTVMPVCDFESPSNLLDLSLNSSRTEDVVPNDDPINLRAPSRPPVYHFGDSSVSLPSTVEVSVLSPSRYCWEFMPSASDSRNASERDWRDDD